MAAGTRGEVDARLTALERWLGPKQADDAVVTDPQMLAWMIEGQWIEQEWAKGPGNPTHCEHPRLRQIARLMHEHERANSGQIAHPRDVGHAMWAEPDRMNRLTALLIAADVPSDWVLDRLTR